MQVLEDFKEHICDSFSHILKCEKEYWFNLIKLCIFENTLFNSKEYFLQNKGIPSSTLVRLLIYFYIFTRNSLLFR